MRTIIILILVLFPNVSSADQGLEISCLNLKSVLHGRKYKPLKFKLEATEFHYFDDQKSKFQTIKSSELDIGEDFFTARFEYDYKNNKFLEHYACTTILKPIS
jgi:hypothetical protein